MREGDPGGSAPPAGETERLLARVRELEVQLEGMRTLVDSVPIGLFSMDDPASGVITRANRATARIFGCETVEEFLSKTAADYYPDPKERAETFARLLADPEFRATGLAKFETIRRRLDDGSLMPTLISVQAAFDEHGRIRRFDGALEDVTERRRAERTFLASEERFRILFEHAPIGVALTDVAGRIARANPAFCAFLRRAEPELLGLALDDLLVLEAGEAGLFASAGARARDVPVTEERRFRLAHGGEAWGFVGLSWILDGEGRPTQGALIVQDITLRKRIDDEVLRVQKLESLALLAGGVAHDFNNFLASILANLSLARRRDGASAAECLRDAEDAALRARELTRQLLGYARGSAPARSPVRLAELAREAVRFCLRGSNVSGEVIEGPDVASVEVDPAQIEQVLCNLVINAREAMASGGALSVRIDAVNVGRADGLPIAPGRYVRVAVADRGSGIAPEHLDRVFDPYFTTKSRGSGLGLATVLAMVQRHRGHVGVRSERGVGTTFTVHLPAAPPSRAPRASDPSPPSPRRSGRVLVMDDEEQLRRVLRAILEQQGFAVDVAGEGGEALRRWEAARAGGSPYLFAIFDVTIRGGMGGEEAMARLRDLDPSAKVIVASGYASGSHLEGFRERGFVGMVEKPFSIDELLRVIDAALTPA